MNSLKEVYLLGVLHLAHQNFNVEAWGSNHLPYDLTAPELLQKISFPNK